MDNFFKKQYDEMIEQMQEQNEKKALIKLIKSGEIGEINTPVLVLNPKYKKDIIYLKSIGIDVEGVFCSYIDEDKVYQILDPDLRLRILNDLNKK